MDSVVDKMKGGVVPKSGCLSVVEHNLTKSGCHTDHKEHLKNPLVRVQRVFGHPRPLDGSTPESQIQEGHMSGGVVKKGGAGIISDRSPKKNGFHRRSKNARKTLDKSNLHRSTLFGIGLTVVTKKQWEE